MATTTEPIITTSVSEVRRLPRTVSSSTIDGVSMNGGSNGTANGAAVGKKPSKWGAYKRHLNTAATTLPSSQSESVTKPDIESPFVDGTEASNRKAEPASQLADESETQKQTQTQARSGSSLHKVMFAQQAVDFLSKRRKNQGVDEEFIKRFNMRRRSSQQEEVSKPSEYSQNKLNFDRGDLNKFIFHPTESIMFFWLSVVALACVYNLWTVISRLAFHELNELYAKQWLMYDLLADCIYFLDIFVQFRTGFLKHGMMVYEAREMATRYLHSAAFVMDVFALLQPALIVPKHVLMQLGRYTIILRCVRFVKVYRALKWSEMIQNTTRFPNSWRVTSLTHFLLLSCHWFAAIYYLLSEYEAFDTQWTYPPPEGEYASLLRKYLVCFCWAALTLTNVGADKTPETNLELTFTILCFLLGLYVFAAIVGQVSNVVMEQNAHRMEFEKMLDTAKGYMQTHNVPNDLQTRVIRWYEFMWLNTGEAFLLAEILKYTCLILCLHAFLQKLEYRGGSEATQDVNALKLLPEKLKAEISIFVHAKALQKVTIFQKCRPEFLHSLVLKMQILICTPGDYICRKDEVAKEMFLVIEGALEVVSDSGQVLKQMEAGDFFGEIGVLNYGGVNRRTADVRSVGYARLFVLSRDDVLEALKDDSEADAIMREYAKERLAALKQMQQALPATGRDDNASTKTAQSSQDEETANGTQKEEAANNEQEEDTGKSAEKEDPVKTKKDSTDKHTVGEAKTEQNGATISKSRNEILRTQNEIVPKSTCEASTEIRRHTETVKNGNRMKSLLSQTSGSRKNGVNANFCESSYSADNADNLDQLINEIKASFTEALDKITSSYQGRISIMKAKIVELEEEVRQQRLQLLKYREDSNSHKSGNCHQSCPYKTSGSPTNESSKFNFTVIRKISTTETVIVKPDGADSITFG